MRRILERMAKFWRLTEERQMASRIDKGYEEFVKNGEEQLRELARKGLSIPVFTL